MGACFCVLPYEQCCGARSSANGWQCSNCSVWVPFGLFHSCFIPHVPQGWQCPSCKRVHAPAVLSCPYCVPAVFPQPDTTSGP